MYDEPDYRLPVTSLAELRPGMTIEDFRRWIDYRDSQRSLIYKAIAALRDRNMIRVKEDRVYPKDYPITT